MITEWVFDILCKLAAGIGGWFEVDWQVPDWWAQFDTTVNVVLQNLSGVSAWVDWPVVLTITAAVVLTWTVGALVKLARAVAAHIPFFGGAG